MSHQQPVYTEFEREVIETLTRLSEKTEAIVHRLDKLNGSVARHSEWIASKAPACEQHSAELVQIKISQAQELAAIRLLQAQELKDIKASIEQLKEHVQSHQSFVDGDKTKWKTIIAAALILSWVIQVVLGMFSLDPRTLLKNPTSQQSQPVQPARR